MIEKMPAISLTALPAYLARRSVVLFFTADWCPDCAAMEPLLPHLVKVFPQWQIIVVDVDSHRELVKSFNILGVPSLLALINGQEVGRLVDKRRKNMGQLVEFLSQLPTDAVE